MSDHRARYKNTGLDSRELRRRREEGSVQLRKQKRDDVLSKRRTLASIETDDELHDETQESLCDDDHISITKEVIDALNQNEDRRLLLETAQKVRKILSKEPQPPFDEVIKSGLVSRFVELLDRSDDTMIQFEVAWILTNICSGTSEQTQTVVDSGAVPKLIALLSSPDLKVCEQSIWALGNIVGDGAKLRDLVISHGFIPPLLALIRPDLDVGFLRNETWVLVNLCRNKDPPTNFGVIQQLMPALMFLIQSSDLAILIDITWAISYITELGPEYCQLIIDSKLVERLTPMLTNPEVKLQTAAIRALGSIVTGSDEQTQAVIDSGALPHLYEILSENSNYKIVKEALWFISNITAGSSSQVQAIIDNRILPIITVYLEKGDYLQQKEANWTIYNMCLSGTYKHLQLLYKNNVVPSLCNLLNLQDQVLVRNALESLSLLLNACVETHPEIRETIEECGGLDKLEALQHHENPDIYNFTYNILEQFFQD